MEVDCDGASAAKRRRERRLRQFLRHERLSVAMALAAAQRHSAPKSAGPETYEAPRRQNTAKAGRRPGVLEDPEPQVGAVTVGYVAAPGPLLVVAVAGWRRRSGRHHRLLPPEGCAQEGGGEEGAGEEGAADAGDPPQGRCRRGRH